MLVTYKWSIEDYHRAIATGILEDKPVELIEGDIIQMSPEGVPHSYISLSVTDYLRELLRDLAVVSEGHPVTLDNSELEPDIAIIRTPIANYTNHHPYPQDIYWLIEIANSSLEKDLKEKKRIYARNQIAEYWIIDLQNNQLRVFTNPQNSEYKESKKLTNGLINPLAFPNIAIEVNRLLPS
ncbi:MAG: Uma2 family endonuclease [Xenococcaceae cyanobacterium MO_188.B32]|nr:Uma2 family endonuclease [Xenococcaceae cyanobacterium MO_188.B32]